MQGGLPVPRIVEQRTIFGGRMNRWTIVNTVLQSAVAMLRFSALSPSVCDSDQRAVVLRNCSLAAASGRRHGLGGRFTPGS